MGTYSELIHEDLTINPKALKYEIVQALNSIVQGEYTKFWGYIGPEEDQLLDRMAKKGYISGAITILVDNEETVVINFTKNGVEYDSERNNED